MENQLCLSSRNNQFLIDWLTFVLHNGSVDFVKSLLGLAGPEIPWQELQGFRNGYPKSIYCGGITISFGADDPRYYDDPLKVRSDMGICVNLSGQGCRYFESAGAGNWLRLFSFLVRDTDALARKFVAADDFGSFACLVRCNVTRIDLAFDDYTGLLDMRQIESDVRDRNYVSKSRKAEILWSDDLDSDIQGCTINIGSHKSNLLVRIYDKAAERGFAGQHWVRVESQIRADLAYACVVQLVSSGHVGHVYSGILRNYLTFRVPGSDSNKSRWSVSSYWERFLVSVDRIRLWSAPGVEYNFSSTEYYLNKQYGAAIVTSCLMHGGSDALIDQAFACFPPESLPAKYKAALAAKGISLEVY